MGVGGGAIAVKGERQFGLGEVGGMIRVGDAWVKSGIGRDC